MKFRLILTLLVALTLILSACGPAATPEPPKAEPTKAPEPTQAPEPTKAPEATKAPESTAVELRMMWYDDGSEGKIMRELLDRYEKENPGVKVVMDTVAYKDLHNILQTAVEGGNAPDMARVTDVSRFRGYYLDMSKYMKDAAGWAQNWPEQTLGWMRKDDDKTGLYGFPTQFTVTGPFINKTLFDQAGVAVPGEKATWDEWVKAAQEVAQKTNTPYAVAIDRSGHRVWGPALSNGATFLDPATGKFGKVDTAGFRKTSEMIVAWHKDKITPAEVWVGSGGNYASAKDPFVNGQLVFYMSGSWQIGGFASAIGDKFEWQAVPNPCGEAGCTGIPGGAALMALGASKHPEEVTKLMEWLSSEAVLEEFSAKSLFIPGHLGLVKKGIQYPSNNEALNVFVSEIPKLMPEAYLLQYHPKGFVLNTEIRDRLSQVITGELTIDQYMEKLQAKVDEANSQ